MVAGLCRSTAEGKQCSLWRLRDRVVRSCALPPAHRSIMRLLLGSRRVFPKTLPQRNGERGRADSYHARVWRAVRRRDTFRRGGALRRNALAERGPCCRCREVDEATVAFKHQARRRPRQIARRTLDAPPPELADGEGLDLPVRLRRAASSQIAEGACGGGCAPERFARVEGASPGSVAPVPAAPCRMAIAASLRRMRAVIQQLRDPALRKRCERRPMCGARLSPSREFVGKWSLRVVERSSAEFISCVRALSVLFLARPRL